MNNQKLFYEALHRSTKENKDIAIIQLTKQQKEYNSMGIKLSDNFICRNIHIQTG